jgi:hypothetical protein
MVARTALLACLSILLAGCSGDLIPGTIYSNDGKVMPFQIEKARRTGTAHATDPTTGEKFTGTYVGILERIDIETSSVAVAGTASASGFGRGSLAPNTANATVYLKGDKGTMLTCDMKIEAGISPHGIGACDDNYGKKYRLQF